GEMLGKRVLVTGCGPIGLLSIISARRAGAAEIVAVDIADFTLSMAMRAGADKTINTRSEPEGLAPYLADKGTFDILYECSGAASALAQGIAALRPRGTIVQLGLGGAEMALPMSTVTAKELSINGSFRFHPEFAVGVELMRKGLIDVKPLITHSVPVDEALSGFELANDRSQAMKVQIAFA
ncbi:MAG: L-idonate 5-dehydrogenase, partial [Mesorhizobium sp.]